MSLLLKIGSAHCSSKCATLYEDLTSFVTAKEIWDYFIICVFLNSLLVNPGKIKSRWEDLKKFQIQPRETPNPKLKRERERERERDTFRVREREKVFCTSAYTGVREGAEREKEYFNWRRENVE